MRTSDGPCMHVKPTVRTFVHIRRPFTQATGLDGGGTGGELGTPDEEVRGHPLGPRARAPSGAWSGTAAWGGTHVTPTVSNLSSQTAPAHAGDRGWTEVTLEASSALRMRRCGATPACLRARAPLGAWSGTAAWGGGQGGWLTCASAHRWPRSGRARPFIRRPCEDERLGSRSRAGAEGGGWA